ncbi:hypothetical protein IWQ62_005206 [Dispira parvispora]|uniref:RlpA-like protein double-psi beta-barrel domain-containing protein n=1 Tax=Dispira parvispora TaxID=1520584 RepID=A0A9W8ARA7_9FUNG|nr:hypothetical protein IWQ62_005206 [Dispira parvispora]
MVSFTKTAFALAVAAGVAVQATPKPAIVYETVTSWVYTTISPTPTEAEAAKATNGDADGETFQGDGTYYSPSVGTGSCGWLNSDDEHVAALNADQFGNPANPNSSPFCGKKIKVSGPKGEVEAKIVDKCPVCKHGDIDLSPGAFDQIADEAEGRVPITWSFI